MARLGVVSLTLTVEGEWSFELSLKRSCPNFRQSGVPSLTRDGFFFQKKEPAGVEQGPDNYDGMVPDSLV